MLAAVDAYLKGVPPHKIVGGTILSSALCLAGGFSVFERNSPLTRRLTTAYRLATTPFEGERSAACFRRV